MLLWDIHTEIFSEEFREKIFGPEIIAALGCALDDKHSSVRTSTVKFFTAVVAQGALHGFYRIFTLKYPQGGFGTRYLRLKSLLHLDMH